jgi:hypothetical protein
MGRRWMGGKMRDISTMDRATGGEKGRREEGEGRGRGRREGGGRRRWYGGIRTTGVPVICRDHLGSAAGKGGGGRERKREEGGRRKKEGQQTLDRRSWGAMLKPTGEKVDGVKGKGPQSCSYRWQG